MRYVLDMTPLVPLLLALSQSMTLAELETTAAGMKPGQNWTDNFKNAKLINDGVIRLVETGALKDGEFERASELIRVMNFDFRISEMRYELALAAAAKGDEGAFKSIGSKWDDLMVSMSRPRRIGIMAAQGPIYGIEPSVKSVVVVMKAPLESRKAALGLTDHAEIKKIVDADQADRSVDFAKLTQKQMMDVGHRDEARQKRIYELLKAGQAKTAKDFANAALVLQHGQIFTDYALAHELCVASMILGNRDASWLAGASYDRMLSHAGHPQRFATQYRMGANGYELDWFDAERINDAIRLAVVHVTLDQAKNRKWD